jgi:hypothetical protein
LYARQFGKAAAEVNLGDPTLIAAPYQEAFYVARIHGRVEVPSSMILSKTHYERLIDDAAYVDFLRHLFTSRSLMFLGFSFLDPAIRMVLKAIRDRLGAVHAGRHVALVVSDADGEFVAELNRYNIRTIKYDPANAHAALWGAIEKLGHVNAKPSRSANLAERDSFAYARQYFASSLTRRKMQSHMKPLKQAVAEGMVLQLMHAAGPAGISRDEITAALCEQLSIDADHGAKLVDTSLQGLATDSLYKVDDAGRLLSLPGVSEQQGLSAAISILVDGAIERLVVREQGKESEQTKAVLEKYFEYLILRRGWDMGAAYAARRPPNAVVVYDILTRLTGERDSTQKPQLKLVRAIEGVLLSPSDAEAAVLAELGRLAFALELVRQSPQDTLFSSHVLPTRIYLDANILMPAIVSGHPFHSIYAAAMDKLISASAASSTGLEVCAYYGFLNEVVSHRRLAKDMIDAYGGRAAEFIERDIRLIGPSRMNVFIAGFARTLIQGRKLSFDDFLSEYAPYRNEAQLATWLRNKGFKIIDQRQMTDGAWEHSKVLHHFEVMFADQLAARARPATLIAHDALQVAKLRGDIKRGERAILVTAHRRLRDAVAYSEFANIGSAMLSGVGLVQMIDLLVGAIGDERSLVTLLWSTRASSTAEKVRRYLVDIALTQYDAALALNLEAIVGELTEDIQMAMERAGADATDRDGEEISLGKYIEAFEPKFYERMRAEQDRLRREGQ